MPNQYKPWTDEQIALLKQLYPKTRTEDIAKQLNRSSSAIRIKAWELGIKADNVYHHLKEPKNKFLDFSEGEKGYIAGLIDGEGSLGVWMRSTKYTPHKIYSYAIPHLIIGNTNKEVILWLQKKLGGSVNEECRKKKQSNHQDFWVWQLSSGYRVKQLLEVVSPFLIIKKAKAIEILNRKKV